MGEIKGSRDLDGRRDSDVFHAQSWFRSSGFVCQLHADQEQLRERRLYRGVDQLWHFHICWYRRVLYFGTSGICDRYPCDRGESGVSVEITGYLHQLLRK